MNDDMNDPFEQYKMQRALTETDGDKRMQLYGPQAQEQVAMAQAVVIAQTDPAKVLEGIRLRLQGKIMGSDGEPIEIMPPVMNQEGIGKMIFILSAFLNDSTRLARLSSKDKDIEKIMLVVANDMTINLGTHWREYGIKDRSMCDFVIDSMVIPSLLVLKRAEDQNEKNWLGRVSFENVNPAAQYKQEKKGSWLEKFKF